MLCGKGIFPGILALFFKRFAAKHYAQGIEFFRLHSGNLTCTNTVENLVTAVTPRHLHVEIIIRSIKLLSCLAVNLRNILKQSILIVILALNIFGQPLNRLADIIVSRSQKRLIFLIFLFKILKLIACLAL